MISPISFTGIKNIGYARIIDNNDFPKSRVIMNMELTDDKCNKDLSNFKKILRTRPELKNDINDRFINIEHDSVSSNGLLYSRVMLNGNLINPEGKDSKLVNFMKGLVHRVQNFKPKDFKIDQDHHLMKEAQEGLIYKDFIDDYVDGSKGELALLKGSGLTEKFDLYFNDENVKLSDKEEEQLFNAVDDVVAVLHEPAYVHQGAGFMDALLKSYSNINSGS